MEPVKLGVNIDHVATLRQQRGCRYPDPVFAASLAEQAGADGITAHLREDRRHIQLRDIEILQQTVETRLNLEMAATSDMVAIAERIQPAFCCLVPERREELTTEGGLDVAGQLEPLKATVARLSEAGILVSLFIDADVRQIKAARQSGAPYVELHTGRYADATSAAEMHEAFEAIRDGARRAADEGLRVNAGHGLNYHNVLPVAALPEFIELNIGHAIVCRAVLSGMSQAVADMKTLLVEARSA
ncbi:MAG: pyridoxine 5'-phosphate synthase [Gammaproteobacteria bacterium]|nr:pyridoxine 5'-phosphate synthase [Gammaproteobacteria bacterium]